MVRVIASSPLNVASIDISSSTSLPAKKEDHFEDKAKQSVKISVPTPIFQDSPKTEAMNIRWNIEEGIPNDVVEEIRTIAEKGESPNLYILHFLDRGISVSSMELIAGESFSIIDGKKTNNPGKKTLVVNVAWSK